MGKFNWEDFKDNKIAVHCDTKQKAKAFLKECEKQGMTWLENNINKGLNYWHVYKQNTCYIAHHGFLYYDSAKNIYFKRLYTIIDYPFDVASNEKIIITNDGKTTTVKLYNGKELIKSAKADCHPDDKFDVITGAELALSRLKEKQFKPYLKDIFNDKKYGYIGEETNLTAFCGEPLYVGDIVEIYEYKRNETICHQFICKKENEDFVYGCKSQNFRNGISNKDYLQIRKVKSYKDLQNNYAAGRIVAITKERK